MLQSQPVGQHDAHVWEFYAKVAVAVATRDFFTIWTYAIVVGNP